MGGFLTELNAFGPLTASGMVLLVVWLIIRGHLIPRSYYVELRADRDYWREAATKKETANRELLNQQSQLLDAALTTKKVIESLPPGG